MAQGLEFEPEVKEWPEIALSPFRTEDQKFVVCLDTMGQDREFTEDEKRFALETVERFIEAWEAEERTALAADRDRRLDTIKAEEEADAARDASIAGEIAQEIDEFEFKQGA